MMIPICKVVHQLNAVAMLRRHPEINIDLFASHLNNQLPTYVAWKPDPSCTLHCYAFPLFSLIQCCLHKIQQDEATGIMLVLSWTTQPWFPQLLQIVYSQPWVMTKHPMLLPCIRQEYSSLQLPEAVTYVIMSSWRMGTKKQYRTFIKKWMEFCRKGQINAYKPWLNKALMVLHSLYKSQLSYSAINTARSALSTFISLPDSG
jgi:hypothetical protein